MNAPEIAVIDYGAGNLLSVQRGLEYCGAKVILTADPTVILSSKRVVLPGVGAFPDAMQKLRRLGLVDTIHELAERKIPLLGICLGMQLLLDESEEFGVTLGLGLIPGRVIPIPSHTVSGVKQKVPHIGWSELQVASSTADWQRSLLEDNSPGDAAYFVHSFMAVPLNLAHRKADCLYGGQRIAAMIGREQIVGCQFHPEKSGAVGLKILHKFVSQ